MCAGDKAHGHAERRGSGRLPLTGILIQQADTNNLGADFSADDIQYGRLEREKSGATAAGTGVSAARTRAELAIAE